MSPNNFLLFPSIIIVVNCLNSTPSASGYRLVMLCVHINMLCIIQATTRFPEEVSFHLLSCCHWLSCFKLWDQWCDGGWECICQPPHSLIIIPIYPALCVAVHTWTKISDGLETTTQSVFTCAFKSWADGAQWIMRRDKLYHNLCCSGTRWKLTGYSEF